MKRLAPLAVLLTLTVTVLQSVQDIKPADLAAKMTGTWKINKDLSPNLSAPARGGREERRVLFAVAGTAAQRGGRGGGGGGGTQGPELANVKPEEIAAQAALDVLHQVPLEMKIVASETEIRFVEPRGERVFKIDGKTGSLEVPGGSIKAKSKWERLALRQEFSSANRKLVKTWSIDASDHLVLTERIESVAFNTKESKTVFDRQ